jgi:hypothetical protein
MEVTAKYYCVEFLLCNLVTGNAFTMAIQNNGPARKHHTKHEATFLEGMCGSFQRVSSLGSWKTLFIF